MRASYTRRDLMLLRIDTRLLSLRGTSLHHNEPPLEHHSTTTRTTREAELYFAHATPPSVSPNIRDCAFDTELPVCCVPLPCQSKAFSKTITH